MRNPIEHMPSLPTIVSASVLLIAVIGLALLEPRFIVSQNLANIALQAAPLILVALAQGIVIISGGIDLSQGAAIAFAGIVGMLAALASNSIWVGWFIVIATGVALSAINGALVGWMRVPAFVATAGMLTYVDGASFLITGGLPIEFPPDGYSWFGRAFFGPVPVAIPVVAIISLLTCVLMHRTRIGRSIYLLGDNEEAARIVGINPSLCRFYVFLIAGFLTGCASIILTGRIDSAPPSLSPTIQFEAIAAVAIGGISMSGGHGGIWRAIAGVVPVAVAGNILNLMGVQTGAQLIIIGGITVGVVALQALPVIQLKRSRR